MITRRALIKGTMFAPITGVRGFRNRLLPFFQAGNRIVINRNGFFVYNGPPALGNLIASITFAAGTDPKGNPYPAGLASIATGAFANWWINLFQNALRFHHTGAGNDGSIAIGTLGAGYQMVLTAPVAAADVPSTLTLESSQAAGLPFGMVSTGSDINIGTVGSGFRVKEGANGKQGVATLVAGTVTVANTAVTANSRFQLTAQDNNSTGALRISARVAGTSFTITSSNAADTGVVAFNFNEPGI